MKTASILLAIGMISACGSDITRVTRADEPDAGSGEAAASEPAVEVFEAGAGEATVVFESGLGNDWKSWQPVANEVAEKARVFAYSRPGYGESEPTDEPRDPAHIVEHLRALLKARDYAPPYVLVGHSFGGTYMELFAKAHPDEVAAAVLVDPRHRDFTTACENAGLQGCKIPEGVLASLPPVQIAEYEGFASASDEIRAAGSFGAYPVRVLTATSHSFSPEAEVLWESMLKSLADEADDGEQRVFEHAGHGLQIERPHEVASAILDLVLGGR